MLPTPVSTWCFIYRPIKTRVRRDSDTPQDRVTSSICGQLRAETGAWLSGQPTILVSPQTTTACGGVGGQQGCCFTTSPPPMPQYVWVYTHTQVCFLFVQCPPAPGSSPALRESRVQIGVSGLSLVSGVCGSRGLSRSLRLLTGPARG